MFATYIHDLNPVIVEVTDSLKLRWYGLAYLMAFVAGYYLLKWMGDRKLWVLPGKVAGDFIAYAAFFGVFLGGRIGNVLVYQRDEFLANPLMIFKVWEGGMASHGGILGLMIFTWFFARSKKVSWTGLGDGLCVVAPLGIMFGRLANFINGELYGRVDRGFGWAMKFPNALWDGNASESAHLAAAQKAASLADNGGEYTEYYQELLTLDSSFRAGHFSRADEGDYSNYVSLLDQQNEQLNAAVRNNEAVKEAVGHYLEPRYPSQLFQAAAEGLALFLLLAFVRLRFPRLPHGVLTGLFFIFYALFRIAMENFREPEIENVALVGLELTMGQFLSLFMVIIGAGFIARAVILRKSESLNLS